MNKEKGLVVITGATRGLGLAIGEAFLQSGYRVAACGANPERVSKLQSRALPDFDIETVDVADDEGVKSWSERVLKEFGTPDILINNAALINERKVAWEIPAADFSRLIDVNIKGVANVIRHFVPAMIKFPRSVTINLSSAWGRTVSPGVSSYCCSKWAVEGLSKVMLRTAFGSHSGEYEDAADWAARALPFILKIGEKHNGHSLSIPEAS
jgi:NADP-dependent 3-hydroxy acid dehydrogenase YdfG